MDVDEARKQALIYSGTVAAGTAAPGKRQAMPFKAAFENYLAHLKAQAEAKGKPPRWWAQCEQAFRGSHHASMGGVDARRDVRRTREP